MDFKLVSDYAPMGDQPQAIEKLVAHLRQGVPAATLLGVTGSGKTFTMANVIAQLNRPVLILSHNKTLAAQLYSEFKSFFPENAVEYFVSYYDYYQPEAYIPSTDTYIEKDLAINSEIDRMRLSATFSLLSGRRDVIVVSSVSCIYGIGNPADFHSTMIQLKVGDVMAMKHLMYRLVEILYTRVEGDLEASTFRVKGDSITVRSSVGNHCYRITFFDDEIEEIFKKEHIERQRLIQVVEPTWDQRVKKWRDEKYQGKGFQEGIPVILTDRGERVRSKTEKIMADYFYRKGIEYKYEQPIYLKGLGTVYPDFSFFTKRVDGEMYWEHCGMVDSPEYARKMVRKIEMYEKNGIFPGERLILTYETEQTVLNTRKIEQFVNRYL
mgnify:CR=1 FL=1